MINKYFIHLRTLILVALAGCATGDIVTNVSSGFSPEDLKSTRVAIVSGLKSPESIAFSDMLATEMLGLGFRVIERNRIEAALEEQKLSLSGILERSDYGALGKIANLDAMFIFLAKYDGQKIDSCILKLIDIKTGEVLLSTNYDSSRGEDMRHTVASIARSMENQLR